jgi:hypothetical protein
VPATRVLPLEMPRLQREIISELLRARRDVEVVEGVAPEVSATEAAASNGADVVILGRDDAQKARALLEALPRLVVLTVADGDLVAWRYGLQPYRERLGELSPAVLSAALHPPDPLPSWWTE